MNACWPLAVLAVIVTAILLANRQPALQPIFRWLPVPLWCYALPMAATTAGWLPGQHAAYRLVTTQFLPFALALLLLGVDLPAVMRSGGRALVAAVIGAAGIVVGAPLGLWVLQSRLPPEAWKGAGTLAGTWTGGTMNLLALRSILGTPEPIFASLIIVDAMVAYSWMALLVAASGFQPVVNRWLRVPASNDSETHPNPNLACGQTPSLSGTRATFLCAIISFALALSAHLLGARLPASPLVSSSTGWIVLLVTTAALGLSLIPPIRRLGASGERLGYLSLYLVLAATGAQARPEALWSAPAWIALGAVIVLVHGGMLLLAGRLLRIPLGTLATASQANIGGVVSAPLVGAVYHHSLVPVGLLLAIAGNALGTYLGLLSATLCRWLLNAGS